MWAVREEKKMLEQHRQDTTETFHLDKMWNKQRVKAANTRYTLERVECGWFFFLSFFFMRKKKLGIYVSFIFSKYENERRLGEILKLWYHLINIHSMPASFRWFLYRCLGINYSIFNLPHIKFQYFIYMRSHRARFWLAKQNARIRLKYYFIFIFILLARARTSLFSHHHILFLLRLCWSTSESGTVEMWR